jgi:hypothetical protein
MSSDWYARKLNTTPQPVQPRPTPPVSPPAPTPFNPTPDMPQEAPRLPQSAVNASRCPGCGSGNYGAVTPESKARCYDCGYPLQQSGSGVGTGITQPGGSGPAQPARQISTANNFNPQGIIGRIE